MSNCKFYEQLEPYRTLGGFVITRGAQGCLVTLRFFAKSKGDLNLSAWTPLALTAVNNDWKVWKQVNESILMKGNHIQVYAGNNLLSHVLVNNVGHAPAEL